MEHASDKTPPTVTRRQVITVSGIPAIGLTLVPGLLIAVLLALFFPVGFKTLWPLTIIAGIGISLIMVARTQRGN